jgi:hypothetical protein
MLELQNLQSRVPFGPASSPAECAPWPQPVSAFNLSWLKGTFVVDQRNRLGRVTTAIAATNVEIEKLRKEASAPIEVGQRQTNGIVLRSGSDVAMERTLRTHAQNQIVRGIVALREPLEKTVLPLMRDIDRASQTSDTLRQRVFSKEACLSRASLTKIAGDRAAFAQLKADYAAWLKCLAPIELFNMAQRCLDDGSPEALPLLDSIRLENFRRPKDSRAFLNAKLLELAQIPEFTEASSILDEVQLIHKQAQLLWATFVNDTSRVSIMKMSLGLNKTGTKDPNDPYSDL